MTDEKNAAEPSGASGGSLISQATGFSMSKPPFEFRCDSAEWLPEYTAQHAKKFREQVGFFHLHEWLKERGIESQHRVIWAGWRNVRLWIAAHLLMVLFPHYREHARSTAANEGGGTHERRY